jgi:hypothetical protein
MLTGAHKMLRMASALTFSELCYKGGDEFPNHIIWLKGDETWVSIVSVEIKAVDAQTFTTQDEKSLNKRLLDNWQQQFSGTGKEY